MTKNKVFAIVPSAGSGTRLDPEKDDKPFFRIGGRPLLWYALMQLENASSVDEVVLIIKEKYLTEAREMVSEHGLKKVKHVVSGGDSRMRSVANGLASIEASGDDIILVHDGARPFLTSEMIQAAVEGARNYGAAVAGLALTSTVKKVGKDASVAGTVDRSGLWEAQTPQAFRYDVLKRAYERADATATDDAYLVERSGQRVMMVPGSKRNIKVTVPEDINLAEAILRCGSE